MNLTIGAMRVTACDRSGGGRPGGSNFYSYTATLLLVCFTRLDKKFNTKNFSVCFVYI